MMLSIIWRSVQNDSGSSSPTRLTVTDSNMNPVVQLVTWLLLALTTLMFCFRLLTRFFLKSNQLFGVEEGLILTAYLFGVGASVTWLVPQGSVFGKEYTRLSDDEIVAGIKTGYTRDLLFLLSLGFAKLSVCAGVLALSPDARHRRITYALAGFIILWAVSALFTTALQCGSHGPWNNEAPECIDLHAFLEYVGITNVLTDAALVALPVAIIYPLQMPIMTRATVISFFASRTLFVNPKMVPQSSGCLVLIVCLNRVIAVTICQLGYLPRLFEDDYTIRALPYYLCTQFVQCTSISTACVVYFWPLLRSLRTGLMWANNTTFTSQYNLSKLSGSNPSRDARSQDTSEGVPPQHRDRRNYIKITTDHVIASETTANAKEPKPYGAGLPKARYLTWET